MPAPRAHAPTPAVAAPDGTQAIRRAASILKAIARAHARGIALADIARAENLPRSTAHRMLKCLVEEGLVEHVEGSRRYQIGNLAYELGLAVTQGALEVSRWRGLVEAVARRTGVTSYLLRRSGLESVCLLKVDGHSVIRVIPVEVGQRRALGVGAGATALLAALDEDSAERVIAAVAPGLATQSRLDANALRAAVRMARGDGYAVSRGMVVDQVFGLGFAIPSATGPASLAVSIAAHESIATPEAVAQWQRILREEIRQALSPASQVAPARARATRA